MAYQNVDKLRRRQYVDLIEQLPQQFTDRMAAKIGNMGTIGGDKHESDYAFPVDGIQQDYNPSANNKVVNIFYIQPDFYSRDVRKRKFMFSAGVSIDDIHRLNPNFISQIAKNANSSANRFKSDFILEQAWGPIQQKIGNTENYESQRFPDTNNKVVISGGALKGIDYLTLIDVRTTLMDRDVGEDDGTTMGPSNMFCAMTPLQFGNLLRDEKIINRDYNDAMALARGDVSQFLGFTFCRMPMLKDNRLTNIVYHTADQTIDGVKTDANSAAGAGEAKFTNVNGERVVFWYQPGLARGEVADTAKSDMGDDYLRLGDKYMYWRFMMASLRPVDDHVHIRVVRGINSPKAHRRAPTEDVEQKTPGNVTFA